MVSKMRKTRVFIDTELYLEKIIPIDDSAAHHLLHVLKLRDGYTVHAFDGNGGFYESKIIIRNKKEISLCPEKHFSEDNESRLNLTLVQGISRGQKMDYTIQKAVELGVKTIVPLLSEFSNVKLDLDRTKKRMTHWKKIIVSACEQCERNILPVILPPSSLDDWVHSDKNTNKIVLHPASENTITCVNSNATDISLICGPEGGLSEKELIVCDQAGYQRISLGPRILRTETAAVAALAICQSHWGDMV
jgi:16S rRNA (uracil1498-N3)-methyltransferase